MTLEEAIKYTLDSEPTSVEDATAEIERYMVWPGFSVQSHRGRLQFLSFSPALWDFITLLLNFCLLSLTFLYLNVVS